jgi:hypothetical protein
MLGQPLLEESKQLVVNFRLAGIVQHQKMFHLFHEGHVLPPVCFFVWVVVLFKKVFFVLEMENRVVD